MTDEYLDNEASSSSFKKKRSFMDRLRKKKLEINSSNEEGYSYDSISDSSEDLFETKKEDIKKYSLFTKFKRFVLNIHDSEKKSVEEGGTFQKESISSNFVESEESSKNQKSKNELFLFRLHWWEWLILLVELGLIIFTLLVFVGVFNNF